MIRTGFILATLTIILAPVPTFAGTTGSLTGTIISSHNGDPIANARVTATSATRVETTHSDLRGNFAFVSLTPDVYRVDVDHDGYQPTTVAAVPVFADTSLHIPFTLVEVFVLLRHVERRSDSLFRPGTMSDVYSYRPATVSLFPPAFANLWALRVTPSITFGVGPPMMH